MSLDSAEVRCDSRSGRRVVRLARPVARRVTKASLRARVVPLTGRADRADPEQRELTAVPAANEASTIRVASRRDEGADVVSGWLHPEMREEHARPIAIDR